MRRVLLALLLLGTTEATAADLSLKRVMLSSAGVGYFEYEADVDGAATLGLDVPLDQVDDLLTSLVVFDSTGAVGTIELPGRDNTRAEFGNVPFGADALRSSVDTLNSLQGVEIAVQGPRPMNGRIVHAERVTEAVPAPPGQPQATLQRTRVTILGVDGMRQFVLEEADSVQVSDPALRARIGQALDLLRREANRSLRHVTLRSTGDGHRTVRVGYVAAAPLWKTSYRLVLPAKDGDPARLQGWAVLENQSGAAWDGVALTLQYGNPVTFRQAIYQSYFVERPEVPVEILGRILPGVDTRARAAVLALQKAPSPAGAVRGYAAAPPPAPAMVPQQEAMAQPADQVQAAEGVEATTFQLPTPVVLAAGHTASVPIIDRSIPAERVDLAVGSDAHPLSAIRITNDTGSSLPAGVLTLAIRRWRSFFLLFLYWLDVLLSASTVLCRWYGWLCSRRRHIAITCFYGGSKCLPRSNNFILGCCEHNVGVEPAIYVPSQTRSDGRGMDSLHCFHDARRFDKLWGICGLHFDVAIGASATMAGSGRWLFGWIVCQFHGLSIANIPRYMKFWKFQANPPSDSCSISRPAANYDLYSLAMLTFNRYSIFVLAALFFGAQSEGVCGGSTNRGRLFS